VLSPAAYNAKTGLALCCPITSRVKGYPFEVALPDGLPIAGVVLADQVRNLDWKARRFEVVAVAPPEVVAEAVGKLATLLA
jgi:mRNA interferase MazF